MRFLIWLAGLAWASLGIQSGRARDFYVRNLPGVVPGAGLPEMHAGRLEVGSKMGLDRNSSLFFWHFRATQPTNKTIVWFNGGPGCSSLDGALLEVGPLRFYGNEPELRISAPGSGAWTEVGNMLFLDQPFGTGFSDPEEGPRITSLEQAGDAVVTFLLAYAEVFPEVLDTEIILAGESFAGQYIPHVYRSLQKNAEARSSINVAGLVLINPWVDPANQYLSYAPFIKEHGLVPTDAFEKLDQLQQRCLNELARGNYGFSVPTCESISEFLNHHFVDPTTHKADKNRCVNSYDISLDSPQPQCGMEWPPALPRVGEWLSRDDVRQALHADSLEDAGTVAWQECSASVHQSMHSGQISREFLPEILETTPLLLMAGTNDYVCNYIGLDRMVANMEWGGESGFGDSPQETEWGSFVSERKLTMAHVANASHMVPYDHLKESQLVLRRWLGESVPERLSEVDNDAESGKAETSTGDADKSSQEDIDRAVYRAYKKAGVVALVVVLVVVAGLGAVWWFRGQGLSGTGFVHALLHSSLKPEAKHREYVPLQRMSRRPAAIPEEENEEDEFVV